MTAPAPTHAPPFGFIDAMARGEVRANRFGTPIETVLGAWTGFELADSLVTADLYAKHPLKLLAVPAGLPREDVGSAAKRYSARSGASASEAGLSAGYERLVRAEYPGRTIESLSDPKVLLFWELFWLHLPPRVFEKIVKARTLAHPQLLSSLQDYLATLDGIRAALAAHAVAVVAHNLAILMECAYATGHTSAPDAYWESAFESWRVACDSDELWEALAHRQRELGIDSADEHLATLRADFPLALLSINCALVLRYAQAGNRAACHRHLGCMSRSGFGGPDLERLLEQTAQAIQGNHPKIPRDAEPGQHREPTIMFNFPFTVPNDTLYDELNVDPEATAHEISVAHAEAVRQIENKRRALEEQLSATYDKVEGLKELEQEVQREAAKPSDVDCEKVAARRDVLARLRRRARVIDPRYVNMREELTELEQRKTALNRINLQSDEQRDKYDGANPPLDLLKLERDERNPFAHDEGLDLDAKTSLALLRRELSSYLAELGEDVFHPSDLTRESFAEDFVFHPLIDEPDK